MCFVHLCGGVRAPHWRYRVRDLWGFSMHRFILEMLVSLVQMLLRTHSIDWKLDDQTWIWQAFRSFVIFNVMQVLHTNMKWKICIFAIISIVNYIEVITNISFQLCQIAHLDSNLSIKVFQRFRIYHFFVRISILTKCSDECSRTFALNQHNKSCFI